MATTMIFEGTTLRDIAAAVRDELMLDPTSEVKVSQFTVTVTYSVDSQKDDFLDDWYERYLMEHEDGEDNIPF